MARYQDTLGDGQSNDSLSLLGLYHQMVVGIIIWFADGNWYMS
jgi:hypothetical protein